MSPRAAERLTELHKWVTVIFLPVLTYFAIKIDRKVDYSYDGVKKHEQMWIHQSAVNEGLYEEIYRLEARTDLLDTKLYNLAQRDNSRAVN
jgi:hypothetical protein